MEEFEWTEECAKAFQQLKDYLARPPIMSSPEPDEVLFAYIVVACCEILKYSQVYEPYRSIVGQERGQTHRDLNERRKIKSNLNQINPNLV